MKTNPIIDMVLAAGLIFNVSILTVMVFAITVVVFFISSLSTASISLPFR